MRRPFLFVVADVWKIWTGETACRPWLETGGLLIGYRTSLDDIVVTHATGPGPRARRTWRGVELDGEHCQRELEGIYSASRGALTFLGDWHTHPLGPLHPSTQDTTTLQHIAADPRYRATAPLLVIYGPTAWQMCKSLPDRLVSPRVAAYMLSIDEQRRLIPLSVRTVATIPS